MNMRTAFTALGRKKYCARAGQRGFTLMELVIVLVVIGVLLAIAMPAYKNYIMKSRRSLAKTALLDLAQRQEKFYSMNNAYSTTASSLGYLGGVSFPLSIKGDDGTTYYTIATPTLTAATATAPAVFSASAAPAGPQVGDACGTFTLDSVGQQSATGSGCW